MPNTVPVPRPSIIAPDAYTSSFAAGFSAGQIARIGDLLWDDEISGGTGLFGLIVTSGALPIARSPYRAGFSTGLIDGKARRLQFVRYADRTIYGRACLLYRVVKA